MLKEPGHLYHVLILFPSEDLRSPRSLVAANEVLSLRCMTGMVDAQLSVPDVLKLRGGQFDIDTIEYAYIFVLRLAANATVWLWWDIFFLNIRFEHWPHINVQAIQLFHSTVFLRWTLLPGNCMKICTRSGCSEWLQRGLGTFSKAKRLLWVLLNLHSVLRSYGERARLQTLCFRLVQHWAHGAVSSFASKSPDLHP